MQGLLTSLVLPPLLLVLACMLGGLLAWRGWRPGGLLVVLAAALQMSLATPYVSDLLLSPLEREAAAPPAAGAEPPAAIIILGAEGVQTASGLQVGALTLERLRAGAALARRTDLPLLVTAGQLSPGESPLGPVMARSLAEDFGVQARWVEARARDTRENASLSVALLRGDGIGSAYLVTHGWHLPRAREAFTRQGFATVPAPVHSEPPEGRNAIADWFPRPDHLAMSWFALREWAGRLVYALRD